METRKRLIEFTKSGELDTWYDEYPTLDQQKEMLVARPARAFRLEVSRDGGETWREFYTIKGDDYDPRACSPI